MSALYLVRAPVQIAALARWAGERGWVGGRGGAFAFDEGRALHHLVDELFGPGVFRPFRLLVPPRESKGSLYAYTGMSAAALAEIAQVHGLPEHLNVLALDALADKPMPNAWRAGQRLGFDLRLRPVRRLHRRLDTETGTLEKGAELDAFLLEALRHHPDSRNGMAVNARTRESVYLDWLAERLAPAATLERGASRLARFQRTRIARGKSAPGDAKGLEGPDATIHGTLTIDDPPAFGDLLARGIGRHRAYGYGMLLLRPPNKPVPER